MSAQSPWVVMKFGGTSVASAEGWRAISRATRRVVSEGQRAVVVCSAMAGVSDALEQLLDAAHQGDPVDEGLARIQGAHARLAQELELELPDTVQDRLRLLAEGVHAARMLHDTSPRVRARLMAQGELMSTELGAAWMRSQGLEAAWVDARELLTSRHPPRHPKERSFLSAQVRLDGHHDPKERLTRSPIAITQGFIATNTGGDTVLLGRGGSDTSAACIGALLDARRVEIWTDVAGMYTAHPQVVPDAHPIHALGYDEGGAMASLGARVLHPRSLTPLVEPGIPLQIRCTYEPDAPGTTIASGLGHPAVKAVVHRTGLVQLRVSRPASWQPVGFVADVSACFKRHGLSIDLMSTSPSTLAITIDPSSAPELGLDALRQELEQVAEVRVRRPVASVSLVGTGVRHAFDQVVEGISVLEKTKLLMVTQGAADHHLTFIVPQSQAPDLVRRLHQAVFPLRPPRVIPTPNAQPQASA